MVWYQKFEYAVGHWLQKTSEHVFGSVLCSPGCFSLFRGSALMDDNVMKRYTTTATRASEYVQYDQGEDRWLCTLLLQQGWRVEYNAASDAYTNAPQEFKEFYNQRRRWGPSTLANTLDLLHSGSETSKRNSSISMLYIFYQIFTVGSSILGPASVSLMIAGDMVIQQTFITPTGLFLVSMTIMYLVTALLHPQEFGLIVYGLMYFICIPSGYLLLTIYSLVNMHIVSWGTRETNREKVEEKNVGILCDNNCKMCCWDIRFQVTQETENLVLQQIQNAVNSNKKADQSTVVAQNQPSTQENLNNIQLDEQTLKNNDRLPDAKVVPKDDVEYRRKMEADDESNESDDSGSKKLDDDDVDDDDDTYAEDDEFKNQEVLPESDWVKPVKTEFLKKLTYANMKRNLKAQIEYNLRNKDQEELCEELVQMLTDTVNVELKDKVGPEDILPESLLEELQYSLTEHARRILKTSRMDRLERRVKRAIEKTLTAPQVTPLAEVQAGAAHIVCSCHPIVNQFVF
ncbi:hypothetical protein AAFF_G00380420 [Aldrovandia affinis]|uniref:chitin synthase n=1 Tax=Aldrovandia affinis TaxID=143900 RepID=A0AAD7T849_9TELE|nr:hypothetical protein AAFF_G00380420 [Aldrovandia affinis]